MTFDYSSLALSCGADFPVIETLDDVLPAIAGREEFVITEKSDGYIVVDYVYQTPATFGCLVNGSAEDVKHTMIRRELRGIKFRADNRRLLARAWHKFFNLNERPETQADQVDWSAKHIALEKLDGSMVHAADLPGGPVLMTMMGVTSVAQAAMDFGFRQSGIPYLEFCRDALDNGFVPIFEWCSPQNQIVVRYQSDQLIMTGLRQLSTGRYVLHHDLYRIGEYYGVPVVRAYGGSLEDLEAFVEHTRALTNFEGYIVAFDTGNRLKLKADEYVRFHRAKDNLMLEKDVLQIILREEDDDLAAKLPDGDRQALTDFAAEVRTGLARIARQIEDQVRDGMAGVGNDMKRFAIEVAPAFPPMTKEICFSVARGASAYEKLAQLALKGSMSSTRIEEACQLWGGARWKTYWNFGPVLPQPDSLELV